MATNYNPSIVSDGLRFCLDAANTKSYPGSGTTWTDISGKNHDGTLTNGPTFSSDNGGCIVFDGSNDHIGSIGTATDLGINNTSTSFSFSIWFKTNNTDEKYMFDNYDGTSQNISFRLDARRLEVYLRGSSGGWINAVRYGYYTLNVWNNAVYTFDASTDTLTAYVNRINTGSSTSNFSGNFESGSSFRIARRPSGASHFSGSIACAMLYNKSLTEAEVKQNYNALKGRFGL